MRLPCGQLVWVPGLCFASGGVGTSAPEILVVYVTAPDKVAPTIARHVVEKQLAACVNIVPVRSIYRWQGDLQDDVEALLIVKTTRARFDALREGILQVHPYEVPEIIALPIEAAHAPY